MLKNDPIYVATAPDGDVYLNPTRGFWSIVKPANADIINYVANPSFESGLATYWHSYSFDNNATLSIVSRSTSDQDLAYDGGYALRVTQNIPSNDFGAQYAPSLWGDTVSSRISMLPGQSLCAMVHVKADRGDIIELICGADPLPPPPGFIPRIVQATATGKWQRLRAVATNQATTNSGMQVVVRIHPSSAAPKSFLLDAITVTDMPISCYFDGDTDGASWGTQPYLSQSTMSRFTREFGEEVFLNDIGFNIISYTGHGMTPIINDTIPYGSGGGAYYNRSWPDTRAISIVGQFESRQGIKSVHRQHSRLVELMGLHRFYVDPQPFVLRYRLSKGGIDNTGVLEIPVVYKGGLEGSVTNLYQERITLAMEAYEELYWRAFHTRTIAVDQNIAYRMNYQGTAPAPMRWRIVGQTSAGQNVDVQYLQNQSLNSSLFFKTSPSVVLQAVTSASDLLVGNLDNVCASLLLRDKTTGVITNVGNHIMRPESVPSEFVLLHGDNYLLVSTDPHVGIVPKIFLTYRDRYLSATDVWRTRKITEVPDTVLDVLVSPGITKTVRRANEQQESFNPLSFKESR